MTWQDQRSVNSLMFPSFQKVAIAKRNDLQLTSTPVWEPPPINHYVGTSWGHGRDLRMAWVRPDVDRSSRLRFGLVYLCVDLD